MSSEHLALGILTAAAAGACIDGAIAFQADEAKQVGRQHGLKLSMMLQLLRRPQWLAATGGQVVGAGLQIFALTLAPLTVVQPTLAFGLVVLLLIGSRRLGEHVSRAQWLAVIGLIAGIGLLAVESPGLSTREPHALKIVLVGIVLLVPMAVIRFRGEGKVNAPQIIIGAGCGFAFSAIAVKMVSDSLANGDILPALGYGVLAGIGALGGQILDMTALQRYAATRVAPPIFAIEIVVPVALAPFLFHETWTHPGFVLLGLAIVVTAGIVVAQAPAVAHMQEEEAASELAAANQELSDTLRDEIKHDVRR